MQENSQTVQVQVNGVNKGDVQGLQGVYPIANVRTWKR